MARTVDTLYKKASRNLALSLAFWLPESRKVRLERWLRGRAEFRQLQRADMVVASFGKSGRTWLRVMLDRVIEGAEEATGRPGPSLFFTHDNYLADYTGHRDSKAYLRGSKVLLLVRDPRDVTVSQYFQWKHRMKPAKTRVNQYPAKDEEVSLFDFVTSPRYGLVRCIDFLNLWAREAERMPELLVVRYEDLRADPAKALSEIVRFLGMEVSPEAIEEAVEYASVENMRAREAHNASWLAGGRLRPGDPENRDSYKVRRAKVGGWRDYFEDDEIARIEAYTEERLLPDFGYVGGTRG